MVNVDIIVPTYGQEEYTIKCFDSLVAADNDVHTQRLIWVDNGSTVESRERVMSHFSRMRRRLSVWNNTNLGFVQAVNIGLNISTRAMDVGTNYVAILNNDTEVGAGWMTDLIGTLERNREIGVVGPLPSKGTWGGWEQSFKNWLGYNPPPFMNGSVEEIRAGLRSTCGIKFVEVPMVAFFCAVLKRSVVERVGMLDERFGVGFGDDDDYCMRATKCGFKMAIVPGVYVIHNHRTTFRAQYSAEQIASMQRKNIAMYKEKHGIKDGIAPNRR